MTPKKVIVGQPIAQFPGRSFNALVDGEWRDKKRLLGDRGDVQRGERSSVLARLKWTGEDPLPPGSVVVLGAALLDPTDDPSAPFEGLQFATSTPEAATPDAQVAITLAPIAATDGVGYGHLAGAAWALVDVSDDAHEFAGLADGTTLASAASGRFPILWKQAGTGDKKWAVILLGSVGGSRLQWGEVTTEISAATPWSAVGSGAVQFKKNADPTTNDGSAVDVDNLLPVVYEVGWIVCCDRSFSPPRVVTGACVPA